MATFTSVGDNIVIDVSVASDLHVTLEGTYNMRIQLQKEVGSPGSGSWTALRTYITANATVNESVSQSIDSRERFRLIVTEDTSGTCTATLTSSALPSPSVIPHEHSADDVLDLGPLATLAGGAEGQLIVYIADDVPGNTSPVPYLNYPQASQAEMETGTEAALRSMSPLLIAQAIAALAGAGGVGDLEPVDNSNTSVSVDQDDYGTNISFTSDSAITVTLDAQSTVPPSTSPRRIGLNKAGAGSITVQMESGAGYFVRGDDVGNSAATTSFTVTGQAFLEIRSNSGGNSAIFWVEGQTSLAKTVAGTTTFSNVVNFDGAVDFDSTIDCSSTLTFSGSGRPVGIVETITGHIVTAANKTYVLDQSAAYAYTVNTLIIDAGSGTCTAKLTIDGVDVTGISAVAVSTTEATGTASAANSVSVGNTLALVISSNSSATDVSFTVKVTRA